MNRRLCFLGFVVGIGLFAADLPYAGKWKMNVAKSNFGESTRAVTGPSRKIARMFSPLSVLPFSASVPRISVARGT